MNAYTVEKVYEIWGCDGERLEIGQDREGLGLIEILDGFMGSGSTGKAAVLEGRDFVGIDLDPANVELAAQRIEFARSKCSE